MAVSTHMRSMKRAKRRITADLHDLLTFPATADGISADLHGPFRENVKAFIDRHARASPAQAFAAGPAVRTWRVAFRVGEAVESGETPATVELVIAEEDVARSRSVVMDVSKKFGLEYRLLHAVVSGHPWYGKWGYEFHAGSFGITAAAYQKAIETLSGTPLSLFFSHDRRPRSQLQNTIMFYWNLSGHQLVTLRELFAFGDNSKVDIVQVETTLTKILKAAGRSRWVPVHALRGAACRRAKSPEIINNCLQTMEGKILSDGSIVTARYNAGTRTMEYSLEATQSQPVLDKNLKQTTEHILHDLKFLYDSLLNPSTMEIYKPKTRRESALSAAATLLDCKQLIKHYDEASHWLFSNPLTFTIWCHIEANGNIAPPQEPVTLPLSATIADLKHEATKAFQETYLIFRHFQAEQLLDYNWMDDKFHVKNLVGSNGTVRIKGRCLDEQRLAEFNMERGIEDWIVDCSCGAKDDDGERMVACDSCGEWQHTRCAGIHDFEEVPLIQALLACLPQQAIPMAKVGKMQDNNVWPKNHFVSIQWQTSFYSKWMLANN